MMHRISLMTWAAAIFVLAGVFNLFLRDIGIAVVFLAAGGALFAAGDAAAWATQPAWRRIVAVALMAVAAVALIVEFVTTWTH